jgi:hypothetical protein
MRSAPSSCAATAGGQVRQRRGACVSDITITFTGPSCRVRLCPGAAGGPGPLAARLVALCRIRLLRSTMRYLIAVIEDIRS